MKLEGRFEYKKALLLTPERIREFETIFLKYCKSVSYKATTVTDTDITFVSADELFSYNNFQNRKIKSLTMSGYNGFTQIITCIFEAGGFKLFSGYNETCICRYVVSSVDVETTLKSDIKDILKKSTARFWLIGKLRLFGVLSIILLFLALYIWSSGVKSNGETGMSILAFAVTMLAGYGFIGLILLLDNKVIKKLFPAIVFAWGEESTNYKKIEQLRHNLLWGILIALAIGVASAFVKDIIPIHIK